MAGPPSPGEGIELAVAIGAAVVFLGALGLHAASILRDGARAGRAPRLAPTLRPGWLFVAIAGATAALALARMALTRYSLFHANFHSTTILDGVYETPWRSIRHYGVFHSLVYGGVMHAFGPDLRNVCRFNEVCAAITLMLMAFVAVRWTGSRLAGAGVIAVGAFHPVLLRLAGSEEGHNLAVMLSWTAIAAIEAQRSRPRRATIALFGSAIALMIDTKQIGIVAFPLIVLLARDRLPASERRTLYRLSAALGLTLLFPLQTLVSEGSGMTRAGFRFRPLWFAISAMSHPLLDPRGAAYLVTPLAIVGAGWALRRMEGGRAAVAMLLGLAGSSLLIAEGVPASLTFRLPTLLMAIVLSGIGLWASLGWLGRRLELLPTPRAGAAGSVLVVVMFAPRALPGWSLVEKVSPSTDEYDALRELARSWPAGASVVQYGWRDPAYRFPMHLLRRDAESERGPVLFWRGIGCRAFALGERAQRFLGAAEVRDLAFPSGAAMLPTLPVDVESGALRPECAELLAGATPVGPARTIATPNDLDLPFAAFSSPSVEVQMFRLAPEIERTLRERGGEGPLPPQTP